MVLTELEVLKPTDTKLSKLKENAIRNLDEYETKMGLINSCYRKRELDNDEVFSVLRELVLETATSEKEI